MTAGSTVSRGRRRRVVIGCGLLFVESRGEFHMQRTVLTCIRVLHGAKCSLSVVRAGAYGV